MCGIVAYTGRRQAAELLLQGLATLEYRGYDSAGIAVIGPLGEPVVRKSAGKLSVLLGMLGNGLPKGISGIGHTRWATHGGPTDDNAHPHTDCRGEVAVAHNGIVENFVELKRELEDTGHEFTSETDSEVIPHLVESYLSAGQSLEEAVRSAAQRMQGANAVVAASQRDPETIAAFRLGHAGGIVVGYGENEMLLASDLPALLPHTREVVYLAAGETVTVSPNGVEYSLLDGSPVEKEPMHVSYDPHTAAKGEYKHFTLKEIHEQPEAVVNSLRGRVSFEEQRVEMEDFDLRDQDIRRIDRVVLIGTGTSLHAAMVGRKWFESLARIPAETDNSSEFRYRDPIIDEKTLVVSVCQSGETADTLSAMETAAQKKAVQITLCNYEGTQTTRIADSTMLIRAGLEIGVASSKTFVCSMLALYLMAIHIAERRGTLEGARHRELVDELSKLPNMLGTLLANPAQYEDLARDYAKFPNFLFLGRGINYPLAMEGALKLKELSYIHAEGYQAAEMKHGPISLIDENMPVVALTPRDELYEKMLNNVSEARVRGGRVIAVATEGDERVAELAERVIYIPQATSLVTPLLMAIPMQLLAYEIAVRRGCDVDQPRNLAKTVTVE